MTAITVPTIPTLDTLKDAYTGMLAADNLYTEEHNYRNERILLLAQRYYYVTYSHYIRANANTLEANYLRARMLLRRTRQNRRRLPFKEWDAINRNAYTRANQLLMRTQAAYNLWLQEQATTPTKRKKRPNRTFAEKMQPVRKRIISPITYGWVWRWYDPMNGQYTHDYPKYDDED